MEVLFIVALAILNSQVALGVVPSYNDLKAQLQPVEVKPGGDDQYFFFIIPVQKNDEPNVLLQMAQAQDKTEFANSSVLATKVNTQNDSYNAFAAEEVNLNDIFENHEEDGPDEFRFQVPVIVPMDFHFTYDPNTASDVLPECQEDTRTWREKVISRIDEKLQLEGQYKWDHTDLTKLIRLRKDALASIHQNDLTTEEKINLYVNTLVNLKILADMRYAMLLNETTTITAGHVSIAAEGVDTYQMLKTCIDMAKAVKDSVITNQQTLATITQQLDNMTSGTETNLALFQQFFTQAKTLQAQEEAEG